MFKKLSEQIQKQFNKMCKAGKLFRANISGYEIWEIYLNSFEENDNPVFRDPQSSSNNCNNCKNFIRRYGNIISINRDGNIKTLFSNLLDIPREYITPLKAIDLLIKSKKIANVFFETYNELQSLPYESCKKNQDVYQLGISHNNKRYTKEESKLYGVVKPNEIRTFYHFNIKLPTQFVDKTGESIEAIMAHYRDKYQVFKRAMEEIPLDTLNLVKDLINQGSLLDGTAHLHSIEEISDYKNQYEGVLEDNWLWLTSYEIEERTAKFKNTLIGVLCTELAEGEELNKACQNWNKRVDPVNYHKATAPITKKQIESAKRFVEENGYEESFDRRLATIEDIKASEILHLNSGDRTIKKVSIFDNVKSTSTRHKRSQFDNVEEISIEKFMKDILPSCSSVEAYLENRMESNLVTITTTNKDSSKPIFKWNNNYSWTFNGNLAGKSQIKEAVKTAGGKVDGILRFSISWNDEDTPGIVDFDAHCKTPYTEIYYSNMKDYKTKGFLDVDMINPNKMGVENITWKDNSNMKNGDKFIFFNRNYNGKSNTGFKAEIEIKGEVYSYIHNQHVTRDLKVATVTYNDGEFTIEHHLPETNSNKEIWSLETNSFHKVNLVCFSPNHWSDNKVGNLHYFFMLERCKTKSGIRGFHNENLLPELLKHRNVMEVLGATNMIVPNKRQLSGIGFNSTVNDELIVKLSGNFKRVIKIKF